MAYTPPLGTAVNFQTGFEEFPRPYNALNFKQTGTAYAAPLGSAVQAQFPIGADWIPPVGNAANFVAYGPPAKIRLSARADGVWTASASTNRSLDGRHTPTAKRDGEKHAPWGAAGRTDFAQTGLWRRVGLADTGKGAAWGAFGELMNADSGSPWVASARKDNSGSGAWGSYGAMRNALSSAKWNTSKPADIFKKAEWVGHLLPYLRRVPFIAPPGNAANFSVVGGGVDSAIIWPGTYTPQNGGALEIQFGNEAYRVPFMVGPGGHYSVPNGRSANFRYAPEYVLVLDENGQPAMEKSARDAGQLNPWGLSKAADDTTVIPWLKFSRPMNPGWGVVTPGTPQPPAPGQTVTVPVRRVYIVVNEILLVRVVGSVPIAAENLSVAFDCDSWLPTFSATIPESDRDAVMPDPSPVEVYVHINGSEFHFFVEKIVRNRSFGKKTVSISGRGIACELDSPYATASQHTNTVDKTAQQIIDSALGFSTYTQTWNITDWLVPANAFSLHGTPAQVAAAVAEASGSVLQADWSTRNLRMLPRYGTKPWDWAGATPDYVIPAAVAQTESLEWLEKPEYNVVYVAGTQQGVLGQVKRTGTAGDVAAPMVTNPLITHVDAARQKGTTILCDTGRKAMMQVSMPVLADTGVIDVCRLVEFSDGANTRRGIVRANSISVNWPTVRQTLTIEASA